MCMKKLLTLSVALLSFVIAEAQDLVFKTLASKGTCIVQRGANPDEYTPVKTGVKIFDNDKIIITGEQSYIGLVSLSGKTLELKKDGVYNVSDLKKGLIASQSSLAQKYVQFLVNDMSKVDESMGGNMKITGSVERSTEKKSIAIFLPETTKIAGEKATVKWYPNEAQKEYAVVITNLFDEEVFKKVVVSTSVDIDFGSLNLASDEIFKMKVSSKENPSVASGVITLRMPSEEEIKRLNTEIKEIKGDKPQKSAIQNMVLATYFDQNQLYLNAIPYFQKAIEIEPEVKEYKNIYNKFLYKIGLQNMQ